jgi:hypothetical protein
MTNDQLTPELERLRVAHERIPDPDPAVLRAVRERLLLEAERASTVPRTRRRRTVRRLALAAAAACAAAIAVTAISIDFTRPGGPGIDAVAQARAAIASPGEIVHYTVALSAGPGATDPDCNAGPLEVWRAANPTRWRAVQPVSADPDCGTVDLSQGYGPIVAPRLEVSYAAGRTSSYVPGRDLMLVIVDAGAPKEGERRAPSSAAGAASIQLMSTTPRARDVEPHAIARAPDPVSDVERLLAKGDLRDDGERVRDGRRVRVLSGGWTRGDGNEFHETTTIDYVVDADTFAPIAVTSTTRLELDGEVTSSSVRASFADYERIPLTEQSAGLLKIDPERPPKVVELTIEDIKNPGR